MEYTERRILENFNQINPNVILGKKVYDSIWDDTRIYIKSLLLRASISLILMPLQLFIILLHSELSDAILLSAFTSVIVFFYLYGYKITESLIRDNVNFIRFCEFASKDPALMNLSEADLTSSLINITRVHAQCISAYNVIITLSNALIVSEVFILLLLILVW